MTRTEAQAPAPTGADQEKEIDIREYAGVIAAGWLWIVAFAVLGLCLAAYVTWGKQPVYLADSLMQVESGGNMAPTSFMAAQGQAVTGSSMGSRTTAESAIIKSRSVIGKAVDQKHLEVRVSPEYFPAIGEPVARFRAAMLSGLWAPPLLGHRYAWGHESARVTRVVLPDSVNSASFQLEAHSDKSYRLLTDKGHAAFSGQVGQSESGRIPGIGQVSIFVQALNALPGTRFHVISVSRESAIGSLQGRLSVTEKPSGSGLLSLSLSASSPPAAQTQLDAVMNAYLEKNVEQQSEQAKQRLAFLKKQLPKLKEERDNAQAKLSKYQSSTGTLDLSAQANALLRQSTNLDQQLAQVDLQRQQLLQEYTTKAPQVRAAAEKKTALERRQNRLQKKLKSLPKNESKFLELRRNVEVNDQLYTQLLNTSQGLQVSKAGITGITHIVDSAYAGGGKVAPKRAYTMFIGLVLGAVAGVLLVLTRALLRTTVSDPSEVERKFGLPVFATIPFSVWESKANRAKQSSPILTLAQPDDPSVESLRSFRTSLQFAMIEGDTKFIGMSGPTPGCGKSFVSSNVATLIAQAGGRVLLVDGDLRRGTLHRLFDIKRGNGLGEVLSGECPVEESLQHSGIDNLDVMLVGQRPPNPAELLVSRNFEHMLKEMEGRYDYVIFDLPPVLNVADANIVAKRMATNFLVVRSDHSTAHEVEQSIARLEKDNIHLSGTVFNGLRYDSLRYGYKKYGYYSYKYS